MGERGRLSSVHAMIRLENTTGKRRGRFVVYEYEQDLFGKIHLTVSSGRSGTVQRVEKHSFDSKIDFLIQLDIKLEIKERYNYRMSNR